jgi:hypothetical protein
LITTKKLTNHDPKPLNFKILTKIRCNRRRKPQSVVQTVALEPFVDILQGAKGFGGGTFEQPEGEHDTV